MHRLLELLQGGDLRSIGRANEAAAEAVRNPDLFGVLVEGMMALGPLVRMRAADAAEKATRERPELLAPYKRTLLREAPKTTQQEVRWHLALMLPRLDLNARERRAAAAILKGWLDDPSRIVQVGAIQGLAELSAAHAKLRPEVESILKRLARTGSPAVRSRCAKLFAAWPRPHGPRKAAKPPSRALCEIRRM